LNIRKLSFGLVLAMSASGHRPQTSAAEAAIPKPEKLVYRIEWRMVTAGEATLDLTREQQNWQINLKLESAGLVSRLFRVEDQYKVIANDRFCAINSNFEAQEGKRHAVTVQQFDNLRHKLVVDERDLEKKTSQHNEVDIPACTYEIIGALAALRQQHLEAGKSVVMPIANGKKVANARIEAQGKEAITVDGKNYSTMRYEAFIFGVLFRKRGRAFVWLSDDSERMPVQMRFQMGFPIGNITLELEKTEKP
jgi:hypothetical protein